MQLAMPLQSGFLWQKKDMARLLISFSAVCVTFKALLCCNYHPV